MVLSLRGSLYYVAMKCYDLNENGWKCIFAQFAFIPGSGRAGKGCRENNDLTGGISIVFMKRPRLFSFFFLYYCEISVTPIIFQRFEHFSVWAFCRFYPVKCETQALTELGLCSASDPDPPSFIIHGENYCQIILECMKRNCLFHFTANLWQMFWGGSHSH